MRIGTIGIIGIIGAGAVGSGILVPMINEAFFQFSHARTTG